MTSSIAHAVLHIDGSFCEGGGQLLRNAVSLSALLSKPISISNVRQNRRPPGLRKQHEAGIHLAAAICSAETQGVHVESTTVDFRPGSIQLPQTLTADTGTAGSTTLLLQVALPCLFFPPSSGIPDRLPTSESEHTHDAGITCTNAPVLTLLGGTNAILAPQIDYTQSILLPFLSRHLHIAPTLVVHRRGYYPKGGGVVQCTVPAIQGPLPPVVLTTRGAVTAVRGCARVGGLPLCIAQRMAAGAHRALVASGPRVGIAAAQIGITAVRERDEDVVGGGGGVLLWAETEDGCVLGGSAVSTREKRPEVVGEEAAAELVRNLSHGGCVDEYLQDQMIIFLALAKGTSVVKVGPLTDHTRTAIHVAQLMTGAKFRIDEGTHESAIITV
ncbi:RNA 3'-terminal phosphate cyclase/enolpyruvate transferase [Chiua virens]|nr:RNA 3'-terminal phosphate cyclase/enolpyruvate transferase [Chiua virens]